MLLERGHQVVGLDSDLYRSCTFAGQIADVPHIEKDIRDVEQNDLLGFDHCAAGGLLAERWGFPAELTLPLRYHHTTPMPPLVGVAGEESAAAQLQIEAVRAGDLIAHYLIRSETEQLAHGAEFPSELVDQGISADLVRDFHLDLTDSFEDLLVSVTSPSA